MIVAINSDASLFRFYTISEEIVAVKGVVMPMSGSESPFGCLERIVANGIITAFYGNNFRLAIAIFE
ncbi:hypothetical protein D3C84_1087840 [compost metagenome]